MHTSTTSNGTRYHHNSDYSGTVEIVIPRGQVVIERLPDNPDFAHSTAQLSTDDIQYIARAATRTTVPSAWADLLEAIELLAKHQNNEISPFHCEHDQLTVAADPAAFTDDEIARLDELGFTADVGQECFYSFRYGSA